MVRTNQIPIKLVQGHKKGVSTQFGALCYRIKNDKIQILLISSRGSGRWLVPKGWPMHKMTPADAAKQEAYEEAGAEGKAFTVCLGIYSYVKTSGKEDDLPCIVAVFPLKVKKLLRKYPESDERTRKWFSPKKAAALVKEPELAQIIREFDPRRLPK